jgi:hypothetical protein
MNLLYSKLILVRDPSFYLALYLAHYLTLYLIGHLRCFDSISVGKLSYRIK